MKYIFHYVQSGTSNIIKIRNMRYKNKEYKLGKQLTFNSIELFMGKK